MYRKAIKIAFKIVFFVMQEALAAEAAEVTEALVLQQKEIESIDRNKTWNWENMCHVTEERTIINKSAESEV